MDKSALGIIIGLLIAFSPIHAQPATSGNLSAIDIKSECDFSGFGLLQTWGKRYFFLGEETSHNLKQTPAVTFKFLKYLHKEANVRVLAIEHGYSVAYLINQYLSNPDSMLLRQISRNTMYWGKENYYLIRQLARFNSQLPDTEKITVEAIDIEYKAESAVLLVNKLISTKKIPKELDITLGGFKRIFEEKRSHREQFDGLIVPFYYDKARISSLVATTVGHLRDNDVLYKDFFGADFTHFARMIRDLESGILNYNYIRPRKHLRFRDDIMFNRMVDIALRHKEKNILCVVGSRHIEKGFSGYRIAKGKKCPAERTKSFDQGICTGKKSN